MKKMKFRNKMICMAVSMVIFVAILSTIVVCVVINKQNRDLSNNLLKRSFDIIVSNILETNKKLLADLDQMVAISDMPSQVKFIKDWERKFEVSIMVDTYRNLALNITNVGVSGKAWKGAIYDVEGNLITFSIINDEVTFLGYAHRFPQLTFQTASLKPGEKLTVNSWKKIDTLPAIIAQKFDKEIPRHKTLIFEKVDNFLCLVSYVPIIAQIINEETKQLEPKQIAFFTFTQKLDKTFISRMSRLTGMKVNIFTKAGLSIGDIDSYQTLQMGAIDQTKEKWSLAQQEALLNDIIIKNDSYFQGALPIYGDSEYVGAIAALYSKNIAKANMWKLIKLLGLVFLACICMIAPIVFIFSNLLTKPINRTIEKLTETAEQVTFASSQVSSASQSLAEGASEQASSLEETSSSLEEMSSMTRQNVDNAQQADQLSNESIDNLKNANASMKSLIQSMEETSTASGNVAKIIKTIDEIAFQTNLLALNAAVEAARAGEAGAGFSVVADEVRNLALRSAEASGNTQELVQNIIQKIEEGSGLVKETDHRYRKVFLSVEKVTELAREISAASQEQAQGIEQVNRAVAEMDKITQQTSANAEESASASEEMNTQAEQMKGLVGDLVAVVGGSVKGVGSEKDRDTRKKTIARKAGIETHKAVSAVLKKANEKDYKPDQVTHMGEGDFKDF